MTISEGDCMKKVIVVLVLAIGASMAWSQDKQPPQLVGQAPLPNGSIVPCYRSMDRIVCKAGNPLDDDQSFIDSPKAFLVHYHIGYVAAAFFFLLYLLGGLHVVDQWDRKPLKRFGKFVGTLGPGIAWREPFSTRAIDTVSVRDQVDNLAVSSSIQTHDNVPVTFAAQLTYRISDAAKFVIEVEDGFESLWGRTRAAISEFVGTEELDAILHGRQALYEKIRSGLQAQVANWGVEIIAVELKDVAIADASIQEAIAMKARAQKEAEAELARAKMQVEIAQELEIASKEYSESSWKLKGFETLTELCRSAENNTIVVPSDLVQGLAKVLGK